MKREREKQKMKKVTKKTNKKEKERESGGEGVRKVLRGAKSETRKSKKTILSRTLDLGGYKMTELNKCYQPIESLTDRHEVKSEKKVVNLKRNILKEKVQEQKGVGVKMGHCEQYCVKKPERMEEELKNGGKSLEMQPDKSQEIKTVQATFKGVKTLGAKMAICGESQKPCFLAIPNQKN